MIPDRGNLVRENLARELGEAYGRVMPLLLQLGPSEERLCSELTSLLDSLRRVQLYCISVTRTPYLT